MQAKYILITRPQPEAEATAAQLRASGYDCIISPVIERAPACNYLEMLQNYCASPINIIASSGYSVKLLSNYKQALKIPLYLTGEKLATQAKKLGFEQVYYASGSAGALIAYMSDNASQNSDYLYLHSNHQAVDVVSRLGKAGFRVQGLEIYQTQQATILTNEAMAALQQNQIDRVLLYSAMSARAFIALCNQAGLLRYLQDVSAVCISENIAQTIPKDLFQQIIVKPLYE
jgi:uroporphyrinogen-III synthase